MVLPLSLTVTIAALSAIVDFCCGYSPRLNNVIGHPIAWIGKFIGFVDKICNQPSFPPAGKYILGVMALVVYLFVTVGSVFYLLFLGYEYLPSWAMFLIQILCGSVFVAQKSLWDHVWEIKETLKQENLDASRKAVGKIVGRDTRFMREIDVIKATLESLGENFSDGVVAPIFYFALFGLPGVVFYKTVNTADSMIGHLTPRYKEFGWASAKLDDLLNYIPARLSALLFLFVVPTQCRSFLFEQVSRQAPLQKSPNAGWPEAALAVVLGVTLGGPKSYDGVQHFSPKMGIETHSVSVYDITRALWVYKRACLWLVYSLVFIGLFLQLVAQA